MPPAHLTASGPACYVPASLQCKTMSVRRLPKLWPVLLCTACHYLCFTAGLPPAARDDAAEQAARARVYARSKSAQPFLGKKSLAAGSTPATDVLQPSPHAALRSFSAPHEADTNPLDLTRRSIRSTAPG